jgi:hypothetical protein
MPRFALLSTGLVVFVCAAVLAPPGLAQARLEVTDIVDHPFSADFASGGKLRLHVQSGDIHVIGVDEDRVSVELSGKNLAEARKLRVRLDRKDGEGELHVSGGPHKELTITVRIPKNTDLYARIPYGDVRIEGVTGNKDVSLHAGDLTVAVGNPSDYARVDASVMSGEVDADAFHEMHGGLFRSFHRTGAGQYRLYAHVGAGQLTLQ